MEKQKLVEWENSRKIELEQHRSVATLGWTLSSHAMHSSFLGKEKQRMLSTCEPRKKQLEQSWRTWSVFLLPDGFRGAS